MRRFAFIKLCTICLDDQDDQDEDNYEVENEDIGDAEEMADDEEMGDGEEMVEEDFEDDEVSNKVWCI